MQIDARVPLWNISGTAIDDHQSAGSNYDQIYDLLAVLAVVVARPIRVFGHVSIEADVVAMSFVVWP